MTRIGCKAGYRTVCRCGHLEPSSHPSIQVSSPGTLPGAHDDVWCAAPKPVSYGPPKWTARGQPTGSLPGSPSGACWDPLRVLLFFCYSSQAYSPSRGSPWVLLWGGLVSYSQAPPGGMSRYRMTFSTALQIIEPW